MLLADSAQAVEGKLYILGGGWNITGPDPTASAIAVYIEVPWDLTNMRHQWKLELVDSDGQPILVPTPMGEQPLVLQGEFEVGRPAGVTPGTGLGVPLAINLGPIPLASAGRFEWRLTIDGQTEDNWRQAFSTRAIPPQVGFPPPET
jgi:hypothetical protein